MQSIMDEDIDLEKFFTDSKNARTIFEQLISSPELAKPILVIHGLGGAGKSSLLKMFRLACRRQKVAVALVGAEEAASPVKVLADWTDDLSAAKVKLPHFLKTLKRYQALQAKVESEAKKNHQLAQTLGQKAAKTALDMAASMIPVVGPFVGALSGAGAEAFGDWLQGFLSKSDLEFYLDPVKRMTEDFLSDLTRAASHQRIVLMIDTYEQMTTLDEWVRELARHLPANVLPVLAGRAVPEWEREWPGWMGKAAIVEQKAMQPDDLRLLVRRYYAHIHGGEPDPQQVEAIVEFARGMPLVVTTVVRLWVKYGVEDFQTVRAQVVADLADRLLEGVPPQMRPAFEAAAVLRYFDVDSLGALLEVGDADNLYAELRRWPFIRVRREGLAVHDTMREMINEGLKVRTPDRFKTLHNKAVAYYERRLESASDNEHERFGYERLYHRISADETTGISLFQEMAEELVSYRLLNRLRALLNEVSTYPVDRENSRLWRDYYNARLLHLGYQYIEAEKICRAIGENEQADQKLKAYALCDLGEILVRATRLGEPGGVEEALKVLNRSRDIAPQMDTKLIFVYSHLNTCYIFMGQQEKGIEFLEQQRLFFEHTNNRTGLIYTLNSLQNAHSLIGNWKSAFAYFQEGLRIIETIPNNRVIKIKFTGIDLWFQIYSGRYHEAEQGLKNLISFKRTVEDTQGLPAPLRDLGLVLGLQGKIEEAVECFQESIRIYKQRDIRSFGAGVGIAQGFWGLSSLKKDMLDDAENRLTEALAAKLKFHDTLGIPEVTKGMQSRRLCNNQAQVPQLQLLPKCPTAYHGQSLG
jgi:tetratricopeptide (TPR) repeat protein